MRDEPGGNPRIDLGRFRTRACRWRRCRIPGGLGGNSGGHASGSAGAAPVGVIVIARAREEAKDHQRRPAPPEPPAPSRRRFHLAKSGPFRRARRVSPPRVTEHERDREPAAKQLGR